MQTKDRERIVVDDYVDLADRATRSSSTSRSRPGRSKAEPQIDREVGANVREVVGQPQHPASVLTEQARTRSCSEVTDEAPAASLAQFGIEVADVRINRTELPKGAEENVYARMRAERERLARKHRAEGEEQARTIRAEADRQARVRSRRGEREGRARSAARATREAARIYADAYAARPGLLRFLRSLEAYRKTLGEGTTLVLPPEHEFFRALNGGGRDLPPPPVATAPPPAPAPAARPSPAPDLEPEPEAPGRGAQSRPGRRERLRSRRAPAGGRRSSRRASSIAQGASAPNALPAVKLAPYSRASRKTKSTTTPWSAGTCQAPRLLHAQAERHREQGEQEHEQRARQALVQQRRERAGPRATLAT